MSINSALRIVSCRWRFESHFHLHPMKYVLFSPRMATINYVSPATVVSENSSKNAVVKNVITILYGFNIGSEEYVVYIEYEHKHDYHSGSQSG
jgi:hypothetical protein